MKKILMAAVLAAVLSCAWSEEPALPDSFKGVVPVFSGARIVLSADTGEGMQVLLRSNGTVLEIIEFYRKAMRENGWIESAQVAVPDGRTVAFQKGGRSLAVTALKPAGEEAHATLFLTRG